MEVYVIRHTRVNVPKGVCYGQYDVPLDNSFHNSVEKYKDQLPKDFNTVITSPLSRCYNLAKMFSVEVEIDERILEYNFGDWEMKKWAEIDQNDLDKWMNDFVNVKAPNGENITTMYLRVKEFFDYLSSLKFDRVLIITHSVVIRCLHSYILEIPLKNLFKFPVDFDEILHLELYSDASLNRIIRMK